MRLFVSTILVTLFFACASFAQSWDSYSSNGAAVNSESPAASRTSDGKIAVVEKKWYVGGNPATYETVETLLKTNPEAASELSTSKIFYYPGLVFAAIGGGAVGYGVVAWLTGDSDIGMPLTLGGVGVCGIAFLLGYVAGNYVDSAVEIYNKSLDSQWSLQVKMGVTPQGGIGLAFAF
ncbi:hypothetical protein [Fibrobacter sp. UBA4297]|uniref:hypothetical protein n=1 Tax=Fibrobacter sp. UBA4297 TaxID=1946536 RepID=UPI0025C44EDC|nr:hypothetical protein [Fibrobacter sp. UBA4297]